MSLSRRRPSNALIFSGKYDYEFMRYVVRVLHKCKQYGFRVYIDPHQDVVRSVTIGELLY